MEGSHFPCSGNKGAVTTKLICAFVFAYAKSRFSHDEAHITHVFAVRVTYKRKNLSSFVSQENINKKEDGF